MQVFCQVAGNDVDEKLVLGLISNKAIAEGMVEQSLMVGTALAPLIGYDKTSKIVKEAFVTGETIRECVLRKELLSEEQLDELLNFHKMTEPNA